MIQKIFKNARVFDLQAKTFSLENIIVKDTKIKEITNNINCDDGLEIIDLKDRIVLKPFCDFHIHLPASFLYDDYGINLSQCASMREMRKQLIRGRKCGQLIRGFGWDINLLNCFFKKSKKDPLEYLDQLFPNETVILFSVDFHTCWCNTNAIKELRKYNLKPKTIIDDTTCHNNCFYDGHIATKIFDDNSFSFTDEEIRSSILKQQRQLLKYGVTEVNAFMFIGTTRMRALRVLWKMDQEGELLIKINCCYDVYPYMTIPDIEKQIKKSQKYCSKHIVFKWLKVYMDGVIENHTAFLKKHYSDKKTTGKCFWEKEKLRQVIDYSYAIDLPLHIHAIGDAASEFIVSLLSQYPKREKKPHVLAHLQLCSKQTMELMAQYNILACLQPFWFYRGNDALQIDKKRLGERVFNQYPANTFLKKGVRILLSSDAPVTNDYNPLKGIQRAVFEDHSNETIELSDALSAYQCGAYENKNNSLCIGDDASFIVLDGNFSEDDYPQLYALYLDGERITI